MKRSRRDSDAKSTAVVSTGRIERKRAHDREAQRASRAKTKAYIAHLEKTVADLTETSGDARANYLAQHATQQSQEIESLQGLVGKIKSLIQDSSLLSRLNSDENDTSGKNDHASSEGSPQPAKRADSPRDSSSPETIFRDDGDRHHSNSNNKPTSQHAYDAPTVAYPASSTNGNLTLLGTSLLCTDSEDTTFFDRLNRIVEAVECHPSSTTGHISNSSVDQDILVRAIMYGWDAAESVHHFDIGWRFIRAFDEGVWHRAGPIERLTHHWMFRNLLLHKMRPTNQPLRPIPTFMRPTATQRSTPHHHALADYYVWPKVRDLIVDRGGLTITGSTSIAFICAMKFDWPFELRDAFHRKAGPGSPGTGDAKNGTFQLSGEFLRRTQDLGNYRLDKPVEQLPLLEHFIPLHPAQLCGNLMPPPAMMTDTAATSAASLNSLLAWHDFRNDDHTNNPLSASAAGEQLPSSTRAFPAFPPPTPATAQDLYTTLSSLETEPSEPSLADDNDNNNDEDDDNDTFSSTFPFPIASVMLQQDDQQQQQQAEKSSIPATMATGVTGPSWAPACSVDAASEAAFMEFAMDIWPVL